MLDDSRVMAIRGSVASIKLSTKASIDNSVLAYRENFRIRFTVSVVVEGGATS